MTTPSSSETAAASGTASALTERERSDRYWSAVSFFEPTAFHYDSLADITADAHLIVRGRLVGMTSGQIQTFGDPIPEVGNFFKAWFGVVAVDEVLKGAPESKSPGLILVDGLGLPNASEADLPAGQVILFLKNYAQMRRDEGVPPSSDADDRFFYVRPNGAQCVLRDIAGVVEIVDAPEGWEDVVGPFPRQLDGSSFSEALDSIRSHVRG